MPGNPCPANGVCAVLKAQDGVALRAADWAPDGSAIGTVFLLNGRTEFIDKYFEAASRLLKRQYRVFALDWRGQGLSQRLLTQHEKGHVGRFADYALDLDALLAFATSKNAPRPWLSLAHSMGGHNVMRYAMTNPGRLDGLALSAPMLGVHLPPPRFAIGGFVALLARIAPAAYAPGQGPSDPAAGRFEGNPLCNDPRRYAVLVDSLAKEPALKIGGVTTRWLDQALASMRFVMDPARLAAFKTRTILFSASADTIVDSASHAIAAKASGAKLITIDGAKHEILREDDRYQDQLWAAFDAWRTSPA